jgi:molybdate transport system substrate-binding protein
MRRGTAHVAAVAAVGLALAGCSSSKSSSNSPGTTGGGTSSSSASAVTGTITVFAASSLTGTFTTLGKNFEAAHPGTKVVFSFGGSSDLATSIDASAPGDVFASASTKTMTTVVSAGHTSADPKNFAKNDMEIATVPGNPKGITTLTDLTKPGIKVAICQPKVPCGDAATALFAAAKVDVKPVTLEKDVKTTLTKVTSKEVDAAIVYVTDVKAAGSSVQGVEIPAASNYVTTYPIAPLTQSKNTATAQAFVDYVLSTDGQAVMAAAGFMSP